MFLCHFVSLLINVLACERWPECLAPAGFIFVIVISWISFAWVLWVEREREREGVVVVVVVTVVVTGDCCARANAAGTRGRE